METLTRPDSTREAFRREIIRLREQTGLSQRAVGRALAEHGGDDVSGSAVGEWERGNNLPSRRNVVALERVYDCDPGHLASMIGYLLEEPQVDQVATQQAQKCPSRPLTVSHLERTMRYVPLWWRTPG